MSEVGETQVLFDVEEPDRKRCLGCKQMKPLGSYSPQPRGRQGVRGRCKRCLSKANMRLRDKDPDKELNRHLIRKFGITLADFQELAAKQGGVCAICGKPPTIVLGKRRQGRAVRPRLVVDHDHITGAVRGLLCTPCNRGIGFLGDDPTRLRAALSYLGGRS